MLSGFESYEKNSENQIMKYLYLVENVVDTMVINVRQGMDKDDYISMGILGLMDAVKKYDIKKNVPFEYYARMRIRGKIIDELRSNGNVSRNRISKLNLVYDAKNDLQQTLSREPTDQEICTYLNIDNKGLNQAYETMHLLSQVFFEDVIFGNSTNNEEAKYSLFEILEDKGAIDPDKYMEEKEMKDVLVNAIEKLSSREQLILNLYYFEELKLTEIAKVLEVSISRVSQVHGKILMKLKKIIVSSDGS